MGRGGERALKTPDDAFIDLGAFATLAVALPATLLLTWLLTVSWAEYWGRRTYVAARFAYADGALFDGTPLTYGTDYVLAAWCAYLGVRATTNVPPGAPSRATRLRLRRLMFKYAVQCLLGGLAHHAHDGTAAYLNRWTFRLLWTAVVGCVASSGADLFAIAEGLRFVPPAGPLRDLARRGCHRRGGAWGLALWLLTALGAFSCTRPAGDIFAVGGLGLARFCDGVDGDEGGDDAVRGAADRAAAAVARGAAPRGARRRGRGEGADANGRARGSARSSAGAEDNGAVAAFAAPDADAVGAAVVVDPLCDYLGLALARELLDRGVAVATVLSDYAFLAGVEYAVDSVSRDGEHKVTALWRYDKRPANGGAFVYRGTWLADAAGAGAVLETLRACLDALGHANGPAHSELIVGDDGAATLVEVNARFHNANVRPLVAACVAGPDAIAAAAAACLPSADEWDAIAADPTLERAGVLAHLVSAVEGPLAAVDGDALARLRSLPTLVDHELYVDEPGGAMVKTVDIKTDSGWALLAGPEAAVAADYAAIQDLQYELFRVDS
ncbi:hypothetical protein JL722_5504 [Aureococcus anophagefferens]|nr:hypothetical protein JL722_5504 [Aureococcus anophagefferens]